MATELRGILQYCQDAYAEYGEYVNSYRLIPGIDGLIPVDRRVLLAAPNEISRSTATAARALEKYHPHGGASPSKMVRQGLLRGVGSHGVAALLEDIPPAAERYTSAGRATGPLNDILYRHTEFVDHEENEMGVLEPRYLPIPVPHALTQGHHGMGLGIATSIPAFSSSSLVLAQEKDDPSLLEAPEGLVLDHKTSELKELWETGKGKVAYSFNVEWDKEQRAVVVTGNGSLFKPRVSALDDWVNTGKVQITDASTDSLHLVIKRIKGVKTVSDEALFKKVKSISKQSKQYTLTVSLPDHKVQVLPLRDWLNTARQNFEDCFGQWQTKTVADINRKIDIAKLLPPVAERLQADKDDEVILKEMSDTVLTSELLNDIKGKPLRLLRKKDFSKEIAKLEEQRESVKEQTPSALIENVYRSDSCL